MKLNAFEVLKLDSFNEVKEVQLQKEYWKFWTFDVSKDDKSKYSKDVQSSKMLFMLRSESVVNLEEKWIFFNDVHPLNIASILYTLLVSKLDKSKEVRDEHPLNKLLIPEEFEVSKLDIIIEVKDEQPLNIKLKSDTKPVWKLERSNIFREEHFSNMLFIFSALFVLKFFISKLVNEEQLWNILPKFSTLLVLPELSLYGGGLGSLSASLSFFGQQQFLIFGAYIKGIIIVISC